MLDLSITLDDKYAKDGQVFMSGTQALVRMLVLQHEIDARNGLDTGAFVSGYRGSPLGGLDFELWRARNLLGDANIVFSPGLNEDLAATAVWGSQQACLFPGAKHDGVFGIWYGKAPGVDRSGDVFKHGNFAGTDPKGGVLLIAGDDHASKSTSTASQSEYAFLDAMIPVLAPADTQDFIDFGLFGLALSRYSGLWVALKVTAANVDRTGTVFIDPERPSFKIPNFEMPPDGVSIRWPDDRIPQEPRLRHVKLPAALAFLRANPIDRTILDSKRARIGILTQGKAHVDVAQALDDLGIDAAEAERLGLRVHKLGMVWPLDEHGLARFANGLDEIMVIEEKRGFVEDQVKTILYDVLDGKRPRVVGKRDETGAVLVTDVSDLDPNIVGKAITARLLRLHPEDARLKDAAERLGGIAGKDRFAPVVARTPFFCSGCPHNTSTVVPEGSHALAGIGCHSLALYQGRATTFTHMGGEGASWIGMAPFTETPHMFQNMGDGTYYHSGILGIRAALAAKVDMTFKILFNDAVAMTGGQPVEGQPTVARISRQVAAEGVEHIVIVSDDPFKYGPGERFAHGTTFRHRDELDAVQRELRDIPGVTVLIYDQTCAAEKRRRRKRGTFPDPARRVVINELVCEGCGDCGKVSNCVSVTPVETEFGRKRAIDQSSCNKDFSCLKGFCPSFVTVEGGRLRKPKAIGGDVDPASLPTPALPPLDTPWSILITGIGGTGVVTIGQILGMAAHLEGKASSVADITGLSQKGGSVLSQAIVARQRDALHTAQIPPEGADALVACDIVTASMPEAISKLAAGRTKAVVNLHQVQTGAFTQNPDMAFPGEEMQVRIEARIDGKAADFLDASKVALALVGDTIATNMFMAGFAFQKGLIPLSAEAIERAITLNRAAVDANIKAFRWGRRAAHDPESVNELLQGAPAGALPPAPKTLDALIEHRAAFLTDYQNAAYADRYRSRVAAVRAAEAARMEGRSEALAEAVARYLFKLMAYKDEYEVARLYTDTGFLDRIARQFEGRYRLRLHLAPPIAAQRDPVTGRLRKRPYGRWMLTAFRVLKRFRFLRGTSLDPFGRTAERRMERQLIADYQAILDEIVAGLRPENHSIAVDLASIPEQIRGYGHVKDEHVERAKAREADLLAAFRAPPETRLAAE